MIHSPDNAFHNISMNIQCIYSHRIPISQPLIDLQLLVLSWFAQNFILTNPHSQTFSRMIRMRMMRLMRLRMLSLGNWWWIPLLLYFCHNSSHETTHRRNCWIHVLLYPLQRSFWRNYARTLLWITLRLLVLFSLYVSFFFAFFCYWVLISLIHI